MKVFGRSFLATMIALVAGFSAAECMAADEVGTVQKLVQKYGIELVLKALVENGDGDITRVDDTGRLVTTMGRPPASAVNPSTVSTDLERLKLSADRFAGMVEKIASREAAHTVIASADEPPAKPKSQKPEKPIPQEKKQEYITACVQAVKAVVPYKDPESVRVDGAYGPGPQAIMYKGASIVADAILLDINAKNSYGAYAGSKPHICYFSQHTGEVLKVDP